MSENGEASDTSLSDLREPLDQSPVGSVRSEVSKSRSRSRSKSKSPYRSRSRSRSHGRSHKRKRRSRSRSRRRYSRSRSRSPYRSHHRSSYRSRSRSRGRYDRYDRYDRHDRYDRGSSSYYGGGGGGYGRSFRSRSRSPMSSRRRHAGNRDDPEPTKCLGVFGLSLYTEEPELRDVFSRYGTLEEVNIVLDRQSGRSRGFAFVYFRNIEDAIDAKEHTAGTEIDGRRIRVDYSITTRAHTPTPGIYLGKPTGAGGGGGSSGGYERSSRRRSPSPYYSRSSRYSRSRSRSYSPRRY